MTQHPLAQQLQLLPGSSPDNALPTRWDQCWSGPSRFVAPQLKDLRSGFESLADGISFTDHSAILSRLVGAAELRTSPIHRWYYYKEGFSPRLPWLIADRVGTGSSRTVLDPFAGVATTALALDPHPETDEVIGIEYSPLAHFIGQSKIESRTLSPKVLRRHLARLQKFSTRLDLEIPPLAALTNADIFRADDLACLLSARAEIAEDTTLSDRERAFFLLGLASVIEDVSGAMKDGRALRILRDRKRRGTALLPRKVPLPQITPHARLVNQWSAMIEDLEQSSLHGTGRHKRLLHLRGDSRQLSTVVNPEGTGALLQDSSIGLCLYSPPYLNCIDYTEVYKLELWLLGFISNAQEFRALREGTLRSHPSIIFPHRHSPFVGEEVVFEFIKTLAEFLEEHLPRAPVGRIVQSYFEDMHEALLVQFKLLEPGAHIACVVGNSTFARRIRTDGVREELWRLPVLTDILLARLAEVAGFEQIQIWGARDLRPRNVGSGSARESVVVARKPVM